MEQDTGLLVAPGAMQDPLFEHRFAMINTQRHADHLGRTCMSMAWSRSACRVPLRAARPLFLAGGGPGPVQPLARAARYREPLAAHVRQGSRAGHKAWRNRPSPPGRRRGELHQTSEGCQPWRSSARRARPGAMLFPAALHHLLATPRAVHWGYFDAALAPALRVRSGVLIQAEAVTHHAGDAPEP